MLYQIPQVQCQTGNVIPSSRLVGLAMAAQIGDNYVKSCSERVDVTLEDLT
jgi:hypothetical protein